jgi:hypothetical protein
MRRITLLTVPHTGTHFVTHLFNGIGAELDHDVVCGTHQKFNKHSKINAYYWQIHSTQKPIPELPRNARLNYESCMRNNRSLIVTARDPYLSCFHYMSKSPMHSLEHQSANWNMFLDIVESRKPFIVDIGCREEMRYEHLKDALDYLKIANYDNDFVKQYAENWTPLNTSGNEMRVKYLKTGELPPNQDWQLLDRAVDWYKSLPTNDA